MSHKLQLYFCTPGKLVSEKVLVVQGLFFWSPQKGLGQKTGFKARKGFAECGL